MAHVVLLDQYAGLGGGQRILMDLAEAFRQAGHRVTVFLPGRGTASESLESAGFPVRPLPIPDMTPGRKPISQKLAYPIHARGAAKVLRRFLEGDAADLIYANAPRAFLPAVLAARHTRTPVTCGLHLIFERGLEHRLLNWCFGRPEVRHVVFCSSAVAAPFRALCGDKGRTIFYWVSPRFLKQPPERAAARQGFGLLPHDLAVGVLGRISRTKGQRLFLEALLPLLPAYPRLKLLVAGAADFEDPAEEARVRAAAAGADPSRVVITGRMVESMAFLDALDVLVVPSLWEEPFGLVAVEGMARTLPVVVTRSGGLPEIVEHGVTGFHAEKDAVALRRAVEPLLADPVLRARMGEAGRGRVEAHFNPERRLREIVEFALG